MSPTANESPAAHAMSIGWLRGRRMFFSLSLAVLVGGCGGSDESTSSPRSDYELAVLAADAERKEVLDLASPSPCSQAQDCSYLKLQPTYFDPCGFTEDIDYSLISATAAQARAAAIRRTELARTAQELAPRPPGMTSCTGFNLYRPSVCIAGRCQH
jgi:hypothetical protein